MNNLLASCLLVFILIQQINAKCEDQTDCSSCAKDSAWGQSCRWCTLTKSCHSFMSIYNKCSFAQNIMDPEDCEFTKEDYSPVTAYKMMMLSAVAYSDDAAKFIVKALPKSYFKEVYQVIADCDGLAKCSGFTAVSYLDEIVVVAFRGFEKEAQVMAKFLESLSGASKEVPSGGKVQTYFKESFDHIWSSLKPKVYALITAYPTYRVFITGHSLGGALAAIASSSIVFDGMASQTQAVLYTFGEPRVGDYDFAMKHDDLVKSSWRVVHYRDVVTHLPPCFQPLGYCMEANRWPYHHGIEVFYSQRGMNLQSNHTECYGFPKNEDLNCSSWPTVWGGCTLEMSKCFADHNEYFGVHVGFWWKTA